MCWFIFALLSSSTASHTPSLAHLCQLIWSLASLSPSFRPPWLFGIRHHHWCIIIILLLRTSSHHLPNLWFCVPVYPLIQVTFTFNGLCLVCIWFMVSESFLSCVYFSTFVLISLCVWYNLWIFFGCVKYLFWMITYWKTDWLVAWLVTETSGFVHKFNLILTHSDEISIYCGEKDSSIWSVRAHQDPLDCFDLWFICWNWSWRARQMMRSLSLEPNVDVAFERLILHVWFCGLTYSI